jgi:hypothetical protein
LDLIAAATTLGKSKQPSKRQSSKRKAHTIAIFKEATKSRGNQRVLHAHQKLDPKPHWSEAARTGKVQLKASSEQLLRF